MTTEQGQVAEARARLVRAGGPVAAVSAYVGSDLRKIGALLSPLLRHDDPEVQHVAHDVLNLLVRPMRLIGNVEDYMRAHREVVAAVVADLSSRPGVSP